MSRASHHGREKPSRTRLSAGKKRPSLRPSTDRSSIGTDIMEAMEEIRDALNSGEPLERRFAVHSYRLEFAARDYGPNDVKAVRQLLGLSRPRFAGFLGVGVSTVRSWEDGSRTPSSIARRFMDEIAANPVYWKGRLQEPGFKATS
jgi:putative transcriptional regulator